MALRHSRRLCEPDRSSGENIALLEDGKAESVAEAVDKAVELARRLENRSILEHSTAAYFKGLPETAAAEESDLEDALSTAAQEMDFDQP